MAEPLVELENVTRSFGEFVAVKDIDLAIGEGEFLAIMGSSGCGKTTTLRMLAGLDQPTRGEIRLRGESMQSALPWQRDTPMVWQNLALFPFMNVRKNVEFGLRMRGVARAERRRRALDWIQRLGIGEFAERSIEQLSGGQRQRVALARALATEPPMLLLDEPLSALDANLKVRMQSVLTALQKDIGITFVYVTHSQSEAFSMADRVVIMSNGRIEQIGTPREIYSQPVNRFVAEFIGGKNIIPGQLGSVDDSGLATVETQHGPLTAHVPEGTKIETGAAVSICIGADLMHPDDDPAISENRLDARVVGEEFIGSTISVHLETEQGIMLQMHRRLADHGEGEFRVGSSMSLRWDAASALVLPDSE